MKVTLGCIALLSLVGLLTLDGALAQDEDMFNSNIDWQTSLPEFEDLVSKGSDKPTMLLVSKKWCGACKQLKAAFNRGNSEAREIEDLAKHFNMVNLRDSDEPHGPQYTPDGGYIPRILFLSKDGKIQNSISNVMGNPKYKYYYSELTQVKSAMRRALRSLAPDTEF
mmetsp:Transcript_39113/g.85114  ORF Transcript_39113/g.85114 Transcript_39113/m.85114 type:complete len:167 (-) Transcript_39113:272-772(-)|eukprot:CAMPEP_0118932170 /NCGR_PEP_ID=MMETSP1169-20130426/9334_1 /TAXON_ID=36882 /ORGANISM="Pyramimonas obovata, Strain CCMP722" /LENGTH=166 /DNA_ID=CAMNT_0006874787 /DNA_START=55 /DNA_END=555 /DNA_ORIENTATION=+